jgi:putative addiction module component (TIGR02574 family)
MTALLEKIEQEAQQLSREERERLASDLVAGLDNVSLSQIDQAWIEEAERRYDDLLSGRVKGIAADVAFEEMRRELKCRK